MDHATCSFVHVHLYGELLGLEYFYRILVLVEFHINDESVEVDVDDPSYIFNRE